MNNYFAGSRDQPRARRAADAVAAGIGLVIVLWTAANVGEPTSTSNEWILNLLEPLPTWFDQIWKIGYFFGLLMVIALFIAAIWNKRRHLLRDMTIAAAVSVVVAFLLAWWLGDSVPVVFPEVTRVSDPDAAFPIIRVAAMTAIIMVAAPNLTRPVRLFGWTMVGIVAVSGFGLGYGLPSDALGAIGLGLVAGGSTLLLFGSPRGYPDADEIAAALTELGVGIADLELVPNQSWGVRTLRGTLQNGRSVEVLAYGRDAADTRIAAKTWRSIWYRESDRTVSFSRFQAVEHEALAMLMAAQHGVNTQEPLAVGVAGDDMALLAVSADGIPLVDPTPDQMAAAWTEVVKLHDAGMAHGSLRLAALSAEDGNLVLGDLSHAALNANETQRSVDIVSLLYESAVVADADAAVAAAVPIVAHDDLVRALAYMQVPALTPDQRKLVDKPKVFVRGLRKAIVEATGAEPPEPAKLRRVRPKDLIMPALSLIAAYALIGLLADIDFVAVWDVVRDATWAWIILGFFVGQTVFLPEGTGMLFATGYPLPMKPLVVLQLAVKWIGLAVPSAAGRIAMNTLFLRKYGVPPTIAVTQGAIDGLSGFVVEAGILLIAFIASDISIEIDVDDVPWGVILLLLLVVVIGVVLLIWRARRLREMVLPVAKEAWGSVSEVLTSPKRTLGLLGSNLASRIILAIVLYLILQAIGTPLPLVTCLIVTVATNLLAGLVPIPGGIGVAEAVLTSFLVFAGLDQDSAFAAAIVFRMTTFYIPAGEGFFATKWLEAGDYI
jgi:uncharacterized membrane protein YbhN (UPF0104 family)/tRNA A-37 threonylcarbamoyl transferase component Bud32